MFRSDRDALAQEVEDLRREKALLDAENQAMRTDLLARHREAPQRIPGGIYKAGVASLGPGERAALSRHELKALPVWAALLAHFATFGMFSLVHMGLQHDRLPQIERDDPSAVKAIGLSFLPYYNLYWVIFNTMRLTDRINLQYRLRGLPDAVPRGFLLLASIIGVIPYLNVLFGVFIFWPFAVFYLQQAVNRLAELSRELAAARDAAATAGAFRPEVAWKSPSTPLNARVEPFPSAGSGAARGAEAAAEAEAESMTEGADEAKAYRLR
jgi:hypothetical protein